MEIAREPFDVLQAVTDVAKGKAGRPYDAAALLSELRGKDADAVRTRMVALRGVTQLGTERGVVQDIGLDEARTPPSQVRLFKTGVNQTNKGNFIFDELSAITVMAGVLDQGNDLMADWEHRSLVRDEYSKPDDSRATAWYGLELRDDGLYAVNLKWTANAAKQIQDGEYRYISPAFEHDPDGRITNFINFALTNRPATKSMRPLVAASADVPESPVAPATQKKELAMKVACTTCSTNLSSDDSEDKVKAYCSSCAGMGMKKMTAALSASTGLSLSSEVEMLTEMGSLASARREVLSLTGAKDVPSAIGVLTAWKASHERVNATVAELAQVKGEQRVALCSTLVESGRKEGKIPPAAEAFWKEEGKSEDGLKRLTSFLNTMPAMVTTPATATVPGKAAETSSIVALSTEDKAMCAMLGLSEEQMLARKTKKLALL